MKPAGENEEQCFPEDLAAASTTVGNNMGKSAANSMANASANTNTNALAKAANRSAWYISLAAAVLQGFFVFFPQRHTKQTLFH